jgi:hypothetical protein
MSPAQYMSEIVLPTVDEYLDARDNLRRGALACIVAWHVRDYLKHTTALKFTDIDAKMKGLCAFSFDVVEGVALGSKHVRNTRQGDFRFTPGDQKVIPAFALDVPGAGLDQGRLDVAGLEVEHQGHRAFVDFCLCAFIGSFGRAFPAEFAGSDLERYGAMVRGWTPAD